MQHRDTRTPGLLRRLEQNLFPPRRALGRRGNQSLLAAFRGQRNDLMRSEFGGFFDRPFEAVEFDDGEEQGDLQRREVNREAFEEGELNFVAPDFLRPRPPYGLSVAQFVDLALL